MELKFSYHRDLYSCFEYFHPENFSTLLKNYCLKFSKMCAVMYYKHFIRKLKQKFSKTNYQTSRENGKVHHWKYQITKMMKKPLLKLMLKAMKMTNVIHVDNRYAEIVFYVANQSCRNKIYMLMLTLTQKKRKDIQ